jgi:hypothetical protein
MDPWADPDYIRDEIENDPPERVAPLAPVDVLVKYGLWPNTHTERDTDVADDEIARLL